MPIGKDFKKDLLWTLEKNQLTLVILIELKLNELPRYTPPPLEYASQSNEVLNI